MPPSRNRLSDDALSAIPTLIVTGGPTVDGALDGALEFGQAIAAQPDTPPDRKIDPAAPVAMTFTGGTTGRPKGAVVSHTARFVSAASTAREHQVTAQDVVGVVTPMFHAVGLMIWYQASILVGSSAVIFRKWDPAEFIAETERHRISSVFLVPVQVRDLLRSPAFDRERLAFAHKHRGRRRADPSGSDRGMPGRRCRTAVTPITTGNPRPDRSRSSNPGTPRRTPAPSVRRRREWTSGSWTRTETRSREAPSERWWRGVRS